MAEGEGRAMQEAFVTLATNDTYALGCLVLGSSLRRVNTTRQLAVMVTPGVSGSMRDQLGYTFDHVIQVNVLDSSDTCNLELLGRPDLSCTFTKFHCWRLTQFTKCVFMDADTLVVQNIDELFDREEFSAAPDAGWPDCFNSGVFVFRPSDQTYSNLLSFAVTQGSFDGGDQGLLNLYFRNWATDDIGKHLPFTYNVVSQAFYSYLPAFKQFYNNIKVVHFIGAVKPWHHSYNTATGTVNQLPNTGHSQEFLQMWWNIFMEFVQPNLDPKLEFPFRVEYIPPPPEYQHDSHQHNDEEQNQLDQQDEDNQSSEHIVLEPEPPERPQDHRAHTDIRSNPSTTMDVIYPYVPPQLDDSPSDPAQNSDQNSGDDQNPGDHQQNPGDHQQPNVIHVPVVYREYQSIETHYCEVPLTQVNPELPPVEHYEASSNPLDRPNVHKNHSQESRPPAEEPWEDKENIPVEDTQGAQQEEQTWDENGNATKGGIISDLATLSLNQGKDIMLRDDRERKLQWEQGQADYLGVDRFDNIMARLDQKIAQPTPSGTKVAEAGEAK